MQVLAQPLRSRLLMTPDAGEEQGGGADPQAEPPAASGATENTGEKAEAGPSGGDDKDKGAIAALQSRVSELSSERRKLERENKDLKDAQAAREEQEAQARGEWEKLAKKHSDRVAELEPALEAAERERDELKAIMESQVKAALGSLSERDRKLFPGDALPLAKQFEWVANAKAEDPAAKQYTPARRGNSPDPQPNGTNIRAGAEAATEAAYVLDQRRRF